MALEIAILGSVEPRVNGDVVGVPAGKQRALLTLLAVHAPEPVSAESAAEALWPRAAPAEALRSLQVTVSRLRRSLGAAGSALETAASGYRLAVEPDAIDARRFETLMTEAQDARVEGDARMARRLLDDALALWRGPALADAGYESFAQAEIARLEELRLAALEERIDARMSQGEHALVVAELEQLSAEHPSRERLVGLLMLALYRCGRQTDALEVYTRCRLRLDEELGLEPSPELQRLQEAILRHDASLEVPRDGGREARHGQPPEGVVTMLFTDIEGSTRLARAAGPLWPQLLAEHHGLVSDAVERAGGRVDGSEGDALFAYFVDPGSAVEAAIAAQQALGGHAWPESVGELRVRMGIHAGLVSRAATGYIGLEVHRAARVTAAGHGGQILVSAAARALLAARSELVDVGEHRLKDFAEPERLWLLVHDDRGPGDFPPLRTEPVRPTNLPADPAPGTRLIGRERERGELIDLICAGDARLVSLVGPGGVGKTRLALELAAAAMPRFRDGAAWVELAAVGRAEHVPGAVARALAVVPLPGETPEEALLRVLEAKEQLLVIDNFEHVLEAAPLVAALLAHCATLTVLATSREALDLAAERVYPVAPLALPAGDEGLTAAGVQASPAGALFVAAAERHDPSFRVGDGSARAIAEICTRLDGLPLAIELAAARVRLLSPESLAARLDSALATLASGPRDAPERQRTLRATIDWSYRLLDAREQAAFARFAVFAGGATVEAAETITAGGLDTLDGLVTKSLLVRRGDASAPTRLGMLETIRAYADERFAAAADVEAVREDHYRYYLALAQRHGTDRALRGLDAGEHLARLDAEIDNLHAALGWAVAQPSAEQALAMAAALGCYWVMRHRYAEALDWVERALDLPPADAHPALRARALRAKAMCLGPVGRGAEQPGVLATLEDIARRLGDPVILSQALQLRVDHELNAERLDVADALADEALHWAGAAGDDWEIAEASFGKAIAASSIADLRERVDVAASLLTDLGNLHDLANLLTDAAYAALCLGSERDASDLAARATPIALALDNRFVRMVNSGNRGLAALLTGETDTASQAFREELTLCREMVVRPQAFEGLRGLAAIAVVNGDDKRAATLVGAADAHRYDTPEDPVEARLERAFFEPARTRYGTDAWNAAAREGGALNFEDAIAYALEEAPV